MQLLWPIVIRDIQARPTRSGLTVLAVALGVALVVAVTSVQETLRQTLLDWIRRWTGPADVAVSLERAPGQTGPESAPAACRQRLAERPEVAAVGPRLWDASTQLPVMSGQQPITSWLAQRVANGLMGQSPSAPPPTVTVSVLGLAPDVGRAQRPLSERLPPIRAGRAWTANETDVLLLDADSAERLGVSPGDRVLFPAMWPTASYARGDRWLRLVGVLEPLSQTQQNAALPQGAGLAVVPLPTAQDLLAEPGLISDEELALSPQVSPRAGLPVGVRESAFPGRAVLLEPSDPSTAKVYAKRLPLGPSTHALLQFAQPPRDPQAMADYLAGRPGARAARLWLVRDHFRMSRFGQEARVRLIGIAGAQPDNLAELPPLLAGSFWDMPPQRDPATGTVVQWSAEQNVVLLSQSAAAAMSAGVGDRVRLPAAWVGTPYARDVDGAYIIGILADPPREPKSLAVAPLGRVREWLAEPTAVSGLELDVDLTGPTGGMLRNRQLLAEVDRLCDGRGQRLPHRRIGLLLRTAKPAAEADLRRRLAEVAGMAGVAETGLYLNDRVNPIRVAAPPRDPAAPAPSPLTRGPASPSVLVTVVGWERPHRGLVPTLVAGRLWKTGETDAVLLDEQTAARLGVSPGDELLLPTMWESAAYRRPTMTVRLVGLTDSRRLDVDLGDNPQGWGVLTAPVGLAARALGEVGRANGMVVRFADDSRPIDVLRVERTLRAGPSGTSTVGEEAWPVGGVSVRFPDEPPAAKLAPELAELPGVVAVATRLYRMSQVYKLTTADGRRSARVQMMGLDGASDSPHLSLVDRVPPLLVGQMFAPTAADELVLDQATAKSLGATVGDTVVVAEGAYADGSVWRGPRRFTITGVFAAPLIADAKGFGLVVAPLRAVQEISGEPGGINKLDVVFDPEADSALRSELPRIISERVGSLGRVQSWSGRQDQIDKNLGLARLLIRVLGMACLLTSVFIVLNTLSINVLERMRQTGLLRCLGLTRGQAAGLVLVEGLAFGVVGVVLGLPLGLGLWAAAVAGFGFDPHPTGISREGLLLAAGGGLSATLVAAVWPAIRALRVSPLAATRAAGLERDGGRWFWSWPAGVALCLLAWRITHHLQEPADKLFFHLFVGMPMLFLGYVLLAPLLFFLLGRPLAWALWWAVRQVGARLPGPVLLGSLNQQRRSLALAAGALLVGAGLVTAVHVSSQSLIRTWTQQMPNDLPEVYAIGPGSYAEELAYCYYLAHRAKMDRLRGSDSFDDPELELLELVRYPSVEASWEPFRLAWQRLNRDKADAAVTAPGRALLTELYIQDVELTRPLYGRLTELDLLPRTAAMVAVDPDPQQGFFSLIQPKFVEGDPATAYRRLAEGGAALVPKSLQGGLSLRVGDRFTVNLEPTSPEATKSFEVVGIVELGVLELLFMYLDPGAGPDSLTAGVFLVGHRDAVAKIDARGLRDKRYHYKSNAALIPQKVVMGRFAEGVDDQLATVELRSAGANITVDSIRGLLTRLYDEFAQIVALVSGVGWLTMMVAGLGVANVMLMKVLRQRRQLGVLRALGLSAGQTALLVVLEAAVVGALGGTLGLMLGVQLSATAQHLDANILGLDYQMHFPVWPAVWTVVGSVGICVVAALGPARRAARMKITEALAVTP